jgi:hypothetical protein
MSFLSKETKFLGLYHANQIKNIKQNVIYYRAKVKFILNKNLFILSKYPFYTEQKSFSYRAFNSHPFNNGIVYNHKKVTLGLDDIITTVSSQGSQNIITQIIITKFNITWNIITE